MFFKIVADLVSIILRIKQFIGKIVGVVLRYKLLIGSIFTINSVITKTIRVFPNFDSIRNCVK